MLQENLKRILWWSLTAVIITSLFFWSAQHYSWPISHNWIAAGAIWAVITIVITVLWRAVDELNPLSTEAKRDKYNHKWFERNQESRLKRMREVKLPTYKEMNRRIYVLISLDYLVEIDLEKFLVQQITSPETLPDLWLESYMNNYYKGEPFQDYQLRYNGVGPWSIQERSNLVDSQGNSAPLMINSEEDIRQVLNFVTRHRNLDAAALDYIASYGIPTLIVSANGGKSPQLRLLRIMLQLKAKIFQNGINPSPEDILAMTPTP